MEIQYFNNIDKKLHVQIYEFEKSLFYAKYALTPNNYEEFSKFRVIDYLCATVAFDAGVIISIIVNERLNNEHVQSIIIGTDKKYRQQGYFNKLSEVNFINLAKENIRYVSLWTTTDSKIPDVFSMYAKRNSKNLILTPLELKLREEYCERRSKVIKNNKRLKEGFYRLKQQPPIHAEFHTFTVTEKKYE